jgi:dTDP-glucose 4,6-dehydratase
VVPNFIDQALRNVPITVYGDGSQTRSFCYCTDLVDGIYRLLMSDHDDPVNIGTQFEMSILDFAKMIIELAESKSEIQFKEFVTEDDPKTRRPDTTKAESILGWKPQVELRDGMMKTIDYFRQKTGAA